MKCRIEQHQRHKATHRIVVPALYKCICFWYNLSFVSKIVSLRMFSSWVIFWGATKGGPFENHCCRRHTASF